MSEEAAGDKTEAPTQKRKDDARDKGDILKSREFATALVVLAGTAWMIFFGPGLIAACRAVMRASFTFGRTDVEDFQPFRPLVEAGWKVAPPVAILFAITIAAAIVSQAGLGSLRFNASLMAPKPQPKSKGIAENRRARFDYFLEDNIEAGIQLLGTEIKALRDGRANIAESYAAVEGREIVLINADIPPYKQANRFNHEPRRPRKLLLHRKQIDKLMGAVQRDGQTIIPLRLYLNEAGKAKLEIALAKGKKLHDKREASAERDWQRDKARLMRDKG